MNTEDWISAEEACALLKVRKQTLYAYVSRKLLRASADAGDSRRSLYARRDVEALAARNKRPRARGQVAQAAIAWGDPVMRTAISGVRDGDLWFGTRRARDLAQFMTLEDVAAHHARVPAMVLPILHTPPSRAPSALGRALADLAHAAPRAAPMQGRTRNALAQDGAVMLARCSSALIGAQVSPGQPVHLALARAWSLSPEGADHLRTALVLLSDHELNPSTFAVCICASTGASMAACLGAGLNVLSGPKHGGVASKARAALEASERDEAALFLSEQAGLPPYAFGYGHPLYPDGDPRAVHLLELLGRDRPSVAAAHALGDLLGQKPNIDAALAALTRAHRLPTDAAFVIFALARVAGWIAHAIEQSESGHLIRPRAEFVPAGP